MRIRPMTIEDYDEIYAMWQITTKRALDEADSREGIESYLSRNEGMSMVAVDGDEIVGTVLAGHDGRIGFIHHMAVRPDYRRKHIGQQLADAACRNISEAGIGKIQIYCYHDNTAGQEFWRSLGFERTENILFEKKPAQEG